MTDRRSARTYVQIAVCLLFWASAFPGIRVGLEAYTPGEVALLRFATASVAFAAFAALRGMPLPARRDRPTIAVAGFLGITVYHVALNYGEVTVQSAAAALLIATVPIFTALLATAFLGERMSAWGWTGIAVAFAGAGVVALGEGAGMRLEPGAGLVLLASVAAAVYIALSKVPLRSYGAIEFTAYSIWVGTLPLLVFAPGLVSRIPGAPLGSTLAVVFLGVFPGAVSYLLWNAALAEMPASLLSAFLYAQPLNAAIIAWLWLGEVPPTITVAGGLVSLGGVVLVNAFGRSRPPVLPDDPAVEHA